MYYRVTRYNFDSSKYDALMAQTGGVKGELRAISGSAFVHVCRTGNDEGMVIAQYDSQASADAAQQQSLAILGGMARLLTSAHRQQMGKVIWGLTIKPPQQYLTRKPFSQRFGRRTY